MVYGPKGWASLPFQGPKVVPLNLPTEILQGWIIVLLWRPFGCFPYLQHPVVNHNGDGKLFDIDGDLRCHFYVEITQKQSKRKKNNNY